ncbi:Cysteine-rich motor neuron 1 protein, partial [Camelus dromedarius]
PTYITIDPPACGELANCSLTDKDCTYGFKLDPTGCRTCQCRSREELCTGLRRGCTLDCPFGFLTDAHNCEICQCRPRPKKCRPIICDKYCPFGYLCVFLDSEALFLVMWDLMKHPKNKHGCDICRCKKCPELPCSKICPLGFQQDSHGCLTCKCRDDFVVQKPELSTPSICHAPGGEYFVEGETWHIDTCTQCTCHSGRVLCETEYVTTTIPILLAETTLSGLFIGDHEFMSILDIRFTSTYGVPVLSQGDPEVDENRPNSCPVEQ